VVADPGLALVDRGLQVAAAADDEAAAPELRSLYGWPRPSSAAATATALPLAPVVSLAVLCERYLLSNILDIY
jgi:hypothetical protein